MPGLNNEAALEDLIGALKQANASRMDRVLLCDDEANEELSGIFKGVMERSGLKFEDSEESLTKVFGVEGYYAIYYAKQGVYLEDISKRFSVEVFGPEAGHEGIFEYFTPIIDWALTSRKGEAPIDSMKRQYTLGMTTNLHNSNCELSKDGVYRYERSITREPLIKVIDNELGAVIYFYEGFWVCYCQGGEPQFFGRFD